jgi:prepilin-type N-terminal cleavage/methylation domain-containing protein
MHARHSHRAFTLIELMLAVAIALVIFGVAIPSMMGLSAEKRLRATFERFDELARSAQLRAISQQRSWTLVWQPGVITLQPDEPSSEERLGGGDGLVESLSYGENESYTIERPASLLPARDTPPEWTFWRSGTCEPVIVGYSGPDGDWTAQYNPLTGHGELIDQRLK